MFGPAESFSELGWDVEETRSSDGSLAAHLLSGLTSLYVVDHGVR